MTKKEKFEILKNRYESNKQYILENNKVGEYLGKIAEFDVDWFCDEFISLLKEYREEIASSRIYANKIIFNSLFHAESRKFNANSSYYRCRKWKPLCDKLEKDDLAIKILFGESNSDLSTANEIVGYYLEEGNIEMVDKIFGYMFSNPNSKPHAEKYGHIYYLGEKTMPNRKEMSNIIESHIRTIENVEDRNNCMDLFLDSDQCFLED